MHGDCLVKLGFDPNHELAGIGFLRGFPALSTKLKIVINRVAKCFAKLYYG